MILPPPQSFEQLVFSQLLTSQSTGQSSSLHPTFRETVLGHVSPPFCAATSTVRVSVIWPPPQVVEHPALASHADILQSTGHPSVLQFRVSSILLVHLPPCFAALRTFRVNFWSPPPHVFVHVLLFSQFVISQSSGAHALLLQPAVRSSPAGHFMPPLDGEVTTLRVLACCPPPQVLEHSPLFSHSEILQSTGQSSSLQSSVSVKAGQALPPCTAAVVTVRVLDRVPPPHVTLQLPFVHLLVIQSTGHFASLHPVVRTRALHALPPFRAATRIVRVSLRWPPPQVVEHVAMIFHGDISQWTTGAAVFVVVVASVATGAVVICAVEVAPPTSVDAVVV